MFYNSYLINKILFLVVSSYHIVYFLYVHIFYPIKPELLYYNVAHSPEIYLNYIGATKYMHLFSYFLTPFSRRRSAMCIALLRWSCYTFDFICRKDHG